MRILITSPHPLWPESSGAARRGLGVACALADAGHHVRLLTPGFPEAGRSLPAGLSHRRYRGLGLVGHFFNPAFASALASELAAGHDLVVSEFPYLASTLVRLCARYGVPLVYNAQNCEADRARQMRGAPVAALISHRERILVKAARAVLCVSRLDSRLFENRYDRIPLLLPNGVDTDAFRPVAADPSLSQRLGLSGKRVALYFGSFDYKPNQRALERLLSLEWPIRIEGYPDTHLLVVGRQSQVYTPQREGVLATGEVADVVPYINLANIVLSPLEIGGGTRLKIIEALACGQAVLSTRFGALGLELTGVGGLHCCDWPDFDKTLRELLADPLQPGSNHPGRCWAESLDWRSLSRAIPWADFTQTPPAQNCPDPEKCAARSA